MDEVKKLMSHSKFHAKETDNGSESGYDVVIFNAVSFANYIFEDEKLREIIKARIIAKSEEKTRPLDEQASSKRNSYH